MIGYLLVELTTHAHKINRGCDLILQRGQSSQWLQLLGFIKGVLALCHAMKPPK